MVSFTLPNCPDPLQLWTSILPSLFSLFPCFCEADPFVYTLASSRCYWCAETTRLTSSSKIINLSTFLFQSFTWISGHDNVGIFGFIIQFSTVIDNSSTWTLVTGSYFLREIIVSTRTLDAWALRMSILWGFHERKMGFPFQVSVAVMSKHICLFCCGLFI